VTRRLPDLATIKIPVLALLSAGSTFSDPVLTRELLTAMAACTLVTLDARHWIPTEQPEAMREILLTPRIRPRASLWQAAPGALGCELFFGGDSNSTRTESCVSIRVIRKHRLGRRADSRRS
jgi:hypothetical protein